MTRLRVLAVAALVAVLGAACGGAGSAVVSVNGDEFDQAELRDLLSDEGLDEEPVIGKAALAPVLTEQAQLMAVEQALVERDVEPVTEGTLNERLLANRELLNEAMRAEGPPSEDDLRAFYEDNPEVFPVELCSRHILVETEEEAEDVVLRLDDGEAFEDLAAEVSLDESNASNGGDLGCVGPGQFVPEFETAALAAEEGTVIGPVETEFGFHVIDVISNGLIAFDLVADQLVAVIAERPSGVVIVEADIEVAPRYGVWDDATSTVVPPPEA